MRPKAPPTSGRVFTARAHGPQPGGPSRLAKVPRRGITGVAIGLVVLASAYFATRATGPAGRAPLPDMPETESSEPPPQVERPATEDERIQRLIEFLLNGDADDAAWARTILSRSGPAARAAVAETARRCLGSNRAFVEHAMDVLLRAPEPGDAILAIEGLSSPDPEVVKRSCLLLGRIATDDSREAIPKLAALTTESWPLPVFALDAVVALGGDAALEAVASVIVSEDVLPGVRDIALARLGRLGGPRAREIAVRALADAESLEAGLREDRVVAACEALVGMKDPAAIPTLRALWETKRDDRALTLLARAADDAALREIETRAHAPLESEDRIVHAITLLQSFPPERQIPVLRHCAGATKPRQIRVEAWGALAAIDGDSRADIGRMLHGSGAATRDDRIVAALVAGRVRAPEWAAHLLAAEAASRDDFEVRAMLLRAMVLGGQESCAETVVRAMAADPSSPLEDASVCRQIAAVFGDSPRPFRVALAPWLVRALKGELGPLGDGAAVQIVASAGLCCGSEAAPAVHPFLTHPVPFVRTAAAEAIVWIPDSGSLAALRAAWWSRQDPISRAAIARAVTRVVLATPR